MEKTKNLSQNEALEIYFLWNEEFTFVEDSRVGTQRMSEALRKGTKAQRDFAAAALLLKQAEDLIRPYGTKFDPDNTTF